MGCCDDNFVVAPMKMDHRDNPSILNTVSSTLAMTELKAREGMLRTRSQLPRGETTIAILVRSECIGLRMFL
jgi:hypothetical protein